MLLVTTLKRGSLYVLPLRSDGKAAAGPFSRYFRSENRFRDTAVSLNGKTIYIATDPGGLAKGNAGPTVKMQHPGAILAFTYTGEGTPETTKEPSTVSAAVRTSNGTKADMLSDGVPPQFTAAQAAKGKTAYNSNCAVCHGTTMTNGAYGTPLAGEYFKAKWSNQTARAFYDRAQKTMPPAHPGSLPADTYANIVAYVFEVNGFKAGNVLLPADSEALDKMVPK
ncbi:MAG: c-type cytochrome [Bryobacteraceae bacterium]